MMISWHGHSCVYIQTDQGHKLLIDPFISGNPLSDLNADTIDADVILVTHAHSDHLGDTIAIAKRTGALVVTNVELAGYLESHGIETHGMQPGGGHRFEWAYVKFYPAIHGSSLDINGVPTTLGLACGILLEIDDVVIYHAGDTALYSDLKLINQAWDIDLAFLPIGDNYTMGPKDAAIAAKWLGARLVVPIHYNTFPLIEQDPQAFVDSLEEGSGVVLEVGDGLQYD